IEFGWDNSEVSFSQIIAAAGEIPIPPYLNRNSEESDTRDYQTVFSRIEGSVAAPTAGLHFTPELLSRLADKGIERRTLTLHVGAGTFKPVKSDTIADHDMHSEFISVSRGLIAELAKRKCPVTAVGTTSV
ncbi:MAG: S-adenosylmethionine:tRNA ribosyltransferase-isomerase, partial [Paramuribaculum sp.]|nr:S-adenosylmethionine:tRNA ribosyltransferase-isomerase [Paramuribaculum sp.]